ncbi:MAG: TSUP family transporter [Pseudomonadota bacterium]
MDTILISIAALLAALLTFFTGFGLGTLLLPVCALFMPVEHAVALTALVHLVNGVFKFALVAPHTSWRIVAAFGLPAVAASLVGAWLLLRFAGAAPLAQYEIAGHAFQITPAKLVVGFLLAAFAVIEILPALRNLTFARRHFFIGGLLSGFFGGLAGMQGALRSAFLVRAGLTKEQFVGTGAAIACLIDITRLGVYLPAIRSAPLERELLAAAALAAIAGALLGSKLLGKVTLATVQVMVAVLLLVVAAGLVSGLL